MKRFLLCCIAICWGSVSIGAQDNYINRVVKYIQDYYKYAIEEQQRAGVPAAITLAQGIHETDAGTSELMTQANNHFGIKCKSDWAGDKFLHDDDAKNECFKKYKDALESYKDHSDHLKRNPRYKPLFSLGITDYSGWAFGLKKCGYATNPAYAQIIIKLIEDFDLQDYTFAAMEGKSPDSAFALNLDTVSARRAVPKAQPTNTIVRNASNTDTVKPSSPLIDAPSTRLLAGGKVAQAALKEDRSSIPDTSAKPIVPTKTTLPDTTKTAPVATTTLANASPQQIAAATKATDTIKKVVVEEPKNVEPVAVEKTSKSNIVVKEDISSPTPPTPKPIDTPKTVVAATKDIKYDSGKVIEVNGLKAIYAYKGEMLLQYAVKYNVHYAHLLDINDLPDAPLAENTLLYLERKRATGTHARHTVTDGETMYSIAQSEAIQLRRLQQLNMMDVGEEPTVGSILELQNAASHKPAIRAAQPATIAPAEGVAVKNRTTPSTDYVKITHKPKEAIDSTKVKIEIKGDSRTDTTIAPIKREPIVDEVNNTAIKTATTNTVAPTPNNTTTPTTVVDNATPKKDTVTTLAVKPQEVVDTVAQEEKDELAALKAELDKVVYPDNSKITNGTTTVNPETTKLLAGGSKDANKKNNKKPEAEHTTAKSGTKTHVVKKGDTVYWIAKKYGVTARQILKWNDIDADDLRPGQKLKILN